MGDEDDVPHGLAIVVGERRVDETFVGFSGAGGRRADGVQKTMANTVIAIVRMLAPFVPDRLKIRAGSVAYGRLAVGSWWSRRFMFHGFAGVVILRR